MSLEFHIKSRDAHQLLADAHNEEIERMAPPEVKREFNTEKITWIEKTGAKGPFQFADPKTEASKPDFQALLQDLKDHGGKFRKDGWFLWKFADSDGIGRKKSKS